MSNRERSDIEWDELADRLRQMRGDLSLSLAEAHRRFTTAPEEPFSAESIRKLVASARSRSRGTLEPFSDDMVGDYVFTSDARVAGCDANQDEAWGGSCGIVGWQPRLLADSLMTGFDSTSIDMRTVRWGRRQFDTLAGRSTDPIVLDVWCGVDEFVALQLRWAGGTAPWDACLDVEDVEMLGCEVAYSTSFDFADYDDNAVEGLLRN